LQGLPWAEGEAGIGLRHILQRQVWQRCERAGHVQQAGAGCTFMVRSRRKHAREGVAPVSCSSWHANRLWLPFVVGWLTKVSIMEFSGGRLLRDARFFFIALIIVEAFADGVSTVVRTISGSAVPAF